MAKTLRVQEADGWTTKDSEDIPANRLTSEEIDDNFLALEAQAKVLSGFKNKIINGNFLVLQRGTSATSTSGYQSADRWLISSSNNVPVLRRSTIDTSAIPGNDSPYCLRINTTADSNAADYQIVSQRIESARTLAGQTATLTFWSYCTTDLDIAVSFRQAFGTGGSPSASVDFNGDIKKFDMTAGWTFHTVVVNIPSVSGKTFGSNSDDYLSVMFWFSAGSNHNTATDSLGQQTGQFYIANVQLEAGGVFSSFEHRPASIEQTLCERYYWRRNFGQLNGSGPIDNAVCSWRFGPKVPMRATPTASSDFTGATYNYVDNLNWAASASDDSNGGLLYFYCNSATARPNIHVQTASANYIALAAEL